MSESIIMLISIKLGLSFYKFSVWIQIVIQNLKEINNLISFCMFLENFTIFSTNIHLRVE